MAERFDVITMGRVGVDIYPLQVGVGLEDVDTFGKFLGGSATNVAVAAARLGHSSAVITRTGEDPFGRFVHKSLNGFGVDDRFVASVPGLPTPVTFCEIFPPDDFPLWFYRNPKAPDLEIRGDELDLEAIATCGVYWTTVTGLSQDPSRSAHYVAWAARKRRPHTILDLDFRPMFWASRREAAAEVRKALPLRHRRHRQPRRVRGRNRGDGAACGRPRPPRCRRRARDRQAGTQPVCWA